MNDCLNGMACDEATAFELRELLSAEADIHGNAFARLDTDSAGRVRALLPLRAGTVTVERLESGRLRYRHTDPHTGAGGVYMAEEILHIRHRSKDGIWGQSPIARARETFALAADQLDASSSIVRNGARVSGILSFPEMMGAEAFERARDSIVDRVSGSQNAGRIMVLDGGATFSPMSMNARDAEFIENRRLSNLDIARLFGVPPTVAGIPDHATYSNVEQETRAFVARCLAPWAKRIESALNAALLTPAGRRRYVIEHDLDGLMRGEISARYEAYRIGRDGGWLSANEIRRAEGFAPIPGGDAYLTPMNMRDAGAACNQWGAGMRQATFKQSDVERALRAAKKVGLYIARYRILKDGSIDVFPSTEPVQTQVETDVNPFDERFK